MDNYSGSIDDPVSLHKYLYCNSDPVNNVDPSGYMTILGSQVAMAGGAVIDSHIELNYIGIYRSLVGAIISVFGISLVFPVLQNYFANCSTDIASGALTSSNVNDDTRDISIDISKENDDNSKYRILNIGAGKIPYEFNIVGVEVYNIDPLGDQCQQLKH